MRKRFGEHAVERRRQITIGERVEGNAIWKGRLKIEPNPERIAPILEYKIQTCAKDVRRVLGMAGWYRRFIPNFASMSSPLSDLL